MRATWQRVYSSETQCWPPLQQSRQNTWRLGTGGKVLNHHQSHELLTPEVSAGSRLTNVANEAPQTPSEGESYRVYLQGKGGPWEWGGAKARWLQKDQLLPGSHPTEKPKDWFTWPCFCLGDKRALQRGGVCGGSSMGFQSAHCWLSASDFPSRNQESLLLI